MPFPQVAEGTLFAVLYVTIDIDAELSRYKQDAARLTRQTGVSSVEEVGNLYLLSQTILTTAIYPQTPNISSPQSLRFRN